MADKRVPVLDPDGRFGFIDEADVSKLPAGARVLTKKQVDDLETEQAREAAAAREQERYDNLPTIAKVAGAVGNVTQALTPGSALTFGPGPGSMPTANAYSEGVTSGLTAGMGQGIARQGIDATMGKEAGDRYAQSVEDAKAAHPLAHGLGNLMGTGAGIVAPIGGAAEQLAGRALTRAGVEGASALSSAGATAAKLGVRGLAEGAAIGAGDYAGEQLLQDHDVATDKLFASAGLGALYGASTGAALGGAGSLIGSGVRAGLGRAAGALTRPAEMMTEAASAAGARAENAAARTAADVEGTAKSAVSSFASDMLTESGMKGRAYDRAWSTIGGGFGLQSAEYTQRAAKYLKNGTRDVGEVLMRKGILDPKWGTIDAVKQGTAEAMLPRIESELESVGQKIGAMTDTSGGRVQAQDILAAIKEVGDPYASSAATRPVSKELTKFSLELADSLGINDVRQSVPVQDLLRERKALDLMVFENAALNTSNVSTQVKRELRSKLEGLVVKALDESSGRMSGDLAAEYKALKKDYVALNIARDVAEDSAARSKKAAFLGLSSLAAGGGSMLKAVGHKLVKEHGDALAATWLYQAAEKGTLAKWVAKTDEQIARASRGLVALPEKGAAQASEVMPAPRHLATKALARVAAFQANPEAFVDHATAQTESISTHSPEIATGLVTRQVRAMAFLASKAPQQAEPDPLDPHPRVHMTPSEEASFARYAWYTERPERFFAEVSRGMLTPEGAETAQVLMPRAFAELQAQTFDALTTQLARGNRLPDRQRRLLGELLDFAATPAQRPQHRTFLQQNVSDVLPSDQQIKSAAPAPSRPFPSSQSVSALDRIESGGPGRRR